MRIGITVSLADFEDEFGNPLLGLAVHVRFNHPKQRTRGETSGTLDFDATRAQVEAFARRLITQEYPTVTIPANAMVRMFGL
jgi:hypothetical protein